MRKLLPSLLLLLLFGVDSTSGQNVPAEKPAPIVTVSTKLEADQQSKIEQQTIESPVGRPIIFVHGCGGDFWGWDKTLPSLRQALTSNFPGIYNSSTAYAVLFDGNVVRFYDYFTGSSVSPQNISAEARFFSVAFYDPRPWNSTNPLDHSNVWDIAIPVKGFELARIIAAIQSKTYVKEVNIVGHSMGGLVARAYLEGLAGPISSFSENTKTYTYIPGQLDYKDDIGSLITVDSPHGGAPKLFSESLISPPPCGGYNRQEIDPASSVTIIPFLNYVPGAKIGSASPKSLPTAVLINSIKSYNNFDWAGDPKTDGILTADTQDIKIALQNTNQLSQSLSSTENSFGDVRPNDADCYYGSGFIYLLHPITCVGAQTQTLQLIFNSLTANRVGTPLGVKTLSFGANVILGGMNLTGNVELSTVAPSNGALVQFSSNNSSVQLPSNIVIPSGVSSTSFSATSSVVNSQQLAGVTATWGRGSASVQVTVNPAVASLQLTNSTLSFGSGLVGVRSIGQVVSLSNSGNASLTIGSISVNGEFLQSNNCPAQLGIGVSCQVLVVFQPSSSGAKQGTLSIASNAPGSPHTVSLSGSGIDFFLSLTRPKRPARDPLSQGQSQSYEITVSPAGGITGTVQLSCAEVPVGLSCSVTPSVVDMKDAAVSVTVTVSVIGRSQRLKKSSTGTSKQILKVNATVQGVTRSIAFPVMVER